MQTSAFYSYQIQPREVDLTKRASLITMGDYILHAAGEDADQKGFGILTLHNQNQAWVLSRVCIELNYFPKQDESFVVETWVEDVNRLMTTRNFIVRNANNEQIGAASTNWVMIDMESRQPLDLTGNVTYADAIVPVECPIERPARIKAVVGDEVDRHRVRYSDIDFNQHTNSMKYLQWMLDTLPLASVTEHAFKRLDINFLHETKYNEELSIHCLSGEKCHQFEIRKADDTAACRAILRWI